jgi:hypothetical protein
MNVASPHEISQTKCLNFNAYIVAKRDPWQRDFILMLNIYFLYKSPKMVLNFSRNTSKSLNKGD